MAPVFLLKGPNQIFFYWIILKQGIHLIFSMIILSFFHDRWLIIEKMMSLYISFFKWSLMRTHRVSSLIQQRHPCVSVCLRVCILIIEWRGCGSREMCKQKRGRCVTTVFMKMFRTSKDHPHSLICLVRIQPSSQLFWVESADHHSPTICIRRVVDTH